MMELFNGNEHAKGLDAKIKAYLASNKVDGKLAIIQIGDNPASEKYVSIKEKIAKKLGIDIVIHKFDMKEMKSLEILVKGSDIIYSPSVKSVIVQLPLPARRLYSLLTKIPYEKDVDMLSEGAKRKYYGGDISRPPPTARACEYFLDSNNIKIESKNVVLIGMGDLVGKPLQFFLRKLGANVSHSDDYRTGGRINSDLIVVSVGVPGLLNGDDISDGCHVIDFSSNMVGGKTMGDLNLDSKLDHLGIISPSPGGMGPLVVRFLLMNHLGI